MTDIRSYASNIKKICSVPLGLECNNFKMEICIKEKIGAQDDIVMIFFFFSILFLSAKL